MTMRLAPTVWAMGTMVQICTQGMPQRSNSLASVAPQRVPVPHVEVSTTACTWAARSRAAISAPKAWAFFRLVPLPLVE
ncbi:hypothetical protein CE91St40_04140 [Oscillospiraceae bacterium]|nr:hypothetical protein CE91St40_04140 [Oscillospiraceae bacterium]